MHFGLVLTLNLAIGSRRCRSPRADRCLFHCKIRYLGTTKANLGFIGVLTAVLLLCSYVPWFSLVLINVFYGG